MTFSENRLPLFGIMPSARAACPLMQPSEVLTTQAQAHEE
jgi:hypothetical protein